VILQQLLVQNRRAAIAKFGGVHTIVEEINFLKRYLLLFICAIGIFVF